MDLGRSPGLSQTSEFHSRQSSISPRISSTHSRDGSSLGPRPSSLGRRESVTEAADRLGWMKGPGGVGTLGKNVRKPGPAKDAFNAWAQKHVPGITIDTLPSTSILESEAFSFGFKEELARIAEGQYANRTNGAAVPDNLSQGKALENAAAAVENWFRKLAANAPGTPRLSGIGRAESNDLIELLDGAGSDDGRGFELSPGTTRNTTVGASGREDLDGLIRGRERAGGKSGKRD
jgi:hypothetical protein